LRGRGTAGRWHHHPLRSRTLVSPRESEVPEILAGAKDIGLDLRAGLHVGDVEIRGQDIAGMSVTIAKRVCDLAGAGEVFVSGAVPPLVTGAGFEFDDRGEYELKGVPGSWRLFAVRG